MGERLYAKTVASGATGEMAALAATLSTVLSAAPPTARNFVVSELVNPENSAGGAKARRAATVLVNLPASDVKRLFDHPAQLSDRDRAALYSKRLGELAGPTPLAFSGEKMVLLVTRTAGNGTDSDLRAMARSSQKVNGMAGDELLANALSASTDKAPVQALGADAKRVLGQENADLWIVEGKQQFPALAQASVKSVGKASVVLTSGDEIRGVQATDAAKERIALAAKGISEVARNYASTTPVQRTAHVAHPNLLVASVDSPAAAAQTIKSLQASPWYRSNAKLVTLVETPEGTDLLTF
jgi:hypothetical protein